MAEAYVYLLRCADGSLYCGWTLDVERRLAQHRAGTASRYTRRRLPVELAWSRPMGSRSEAMREEARIKRLTRREKLDLLAPAMDPGEGQALHAERSRKRRARLEVAEQ